MSKIPTFLSSWRAMLLHALTLPIFFLVFILFYESEWMITFLESDSNKVVFNALMLLYQECISAFLYVLTLLISKMTFSYLCNIRIVKHHSAIRLV